MARAKQTAQIMQMSISQWEKAFPNERACDDYLIAHRWPDGVSFSQSHGRLPGSRPPSGLHCSALSRRTKQKICDRCWSSRAKDVSCCCG